MNSTQGLIWNYNEDRVTIITNVKAKDNFVGEWPKIFFFGIFDGHGGNKCADYLKNNLYKHIFNSPNFPYNVMKALQEGFSNAEKEFETLSLKQFEIEKSGSCAIVVLIVNDLIYCANVGDSRAFISLKNGSSYVELSNDHKPENPNEKKRILQNGGKVA